mmetsp:Transcript_31249/g.58687  ORF Transcript_31249/g.58687 Transcript_31249/m.58687 type:complete len:125 (-) Transcript_31249:295-669(-)
MHSLEKPAVIRGIAWHSQAVLTFVTDQVLKHHVQERRFAKTLHWQLLRRFLELMAVSTFASLMGGDGHLMTPPFSPTTLRWCAAIGSQCPWFPLAQTQQQSLRLWQMLAQLVRLRQACLVRAEI